MLTHVHQIASFHILRYECQIDLWFRFSFDEANLSGFLARERIHQHVNISWYTRTKTCNAPKTEHGYIFCGMIIFYNSSECFVCWLLISFHAMHIMKLLSRHKKDTSIFRFPCVPLFNFLLCQPWWLINFKPSFEPLNAHRIKCKTYYWN